MTVRVALVYDAAGNLVNRVLAVDPLGPAVVPTGGRWAWDPGHDAAAEATSRRRRKMRVFRLAFLRALTLLPSGQDGVTLHQSVYDVLATLPADHPAVLWEANVTEVIRDHPDLEALQATFALTDIQIDQIFTLAMAIERGANATEIAETLQGFSAP